MDLSAKIPPKRARIEILPLIDCMFLLLVFFVYSMMTMTQSRGIFVNLPRASTASTIREEPLSISVTDSDEIYLDREKLSLAELETRLAAERAADPSLKVLIKGDTLARHGTVVMALNLLRKLSIESVAIQTAPAGPAPVETPPTEREGK
jgi:biopolymer transport protein ExbD